MVDKYLVYNGQMYNVNSIKLDTETGQAIFDTTLRKENIIESGNLIKSITRFGDDLPMSILKWFIDTKRSLMFFDDKIYNMNREKNIDTIRKLIDPKLSKYTPVDLINILNFVFNTPYWNNKIYAPIVLVKRERNGIKTIDRIFAQYKNFVLSKASNKVFSDISTNQESFKDL